MRRMVNPSLKAFLVTLLVTTVSLVLLIGLAVKFYGVDTNFPAVLGIGSCIGLVTQPILKRRYQMRGGSTK